MKSKLAASIYLLSAGKCWINTRSKISSRSIIAVFDRLHGQIDCGFHARGFESSNRAVHSLALEDDAFSELGPGESECCLKKIKLVTEKLDDFLDDDVSSELDPGISECSVEKIKLVSEEPDAFLDNAFSELGPGLSECSAKQIKLVTEKRDHILSHRRELGSKNLSSDSSDYRPNVKELFEAITRASSTSSTKSHAPVHASTPTDCKESASRPVSSDYKPNAKEFFGGIAQAYTSSSTKLRTPSSTDHKELASPSKPVSSEVNDLSGAITKASTASSTKLCSPVHAPTSTDDARKNSEMECPISVSIKNIPSKVGLPELIEAISVFGKVSGASFVTTSDKFKRCNIEFEDAESSRRAILAGKVEVGGNVFLVNLLGDVDVVAVSIKNINKNSADSAIHSICKSVGELVGLSRTSKDGVDAFFHVRNHTSHRDIVKKLNKTVLDLNHWSACMLTSISNSSGVPSNKNARYKLNQQIFYHFYGLRRELCFKKIYLHDLECLNAGIMHLQDVPPAPYQSE